MTRYKGNTGVFLRTADESDVGISAFSTGEEALGTEDTETIDSGGSNGTVLSFPIQSAAGGFASGGCGNIGGGRGCSGSGGLLGGGLGGIFGGLGGLFDLEAQDLMLILLFLYLYMQSGDTEFLIMIAVLALKDV
ncbi:MAG: hypothetical protein LBO63_03570 [Oscillospiraceae bacterium]|jgi:hypothetical protein|nr:hypothetical protein [Oscillospiraceae bacterium]